MRPHPLTPSAAVLLAVGWLGLAPCAAEPARYDVDVELRGLSGALEDNARASLEIRREAREEDELTEPRIHDLHDEAPAQIERALQPFGYYRPVIRSSLERRGDTWVATYEVDPGPPMRIDDVQVAVTGPGAGDEGFRRAVGEFPLRRGDVLEHPAYEQGKVAFAAHAAQHGYLDATFTTSEIRVDLAAYEADVVLSFETGQRFHFGDVSFEQDVVEPALLHRYVPWRRGEPLDVGKLMELQGALGESPYFSRVEVQTRRDLARGTEVPVVVTLSPAKPQRWQIGVGYGTDTGPRLSIGLDQRRLNRRGHHGELDLLVSSIERSASLELHVPGARPRTDRRTYSLAYRDLNTDTQQSRTGLVGAGLTRQRGRWTEAFALTWQRESFEVGPDPIAEQGFADRGTVNLLVPSAGWSQVDAADRIYPLRGHRLELRVRGANEGLLSDASFAQIIVGGKLVRSLGPDVRAHARLDVGHTETSNLRCLPATIRFFAGGDGSVRGYPFQSLGPTAAEVDPCPGASSTTITGDAIVGGATMVTASLEVDWLPIERWGRWGIAAFHDWGNAALSFDALDLAGGAGAGLRWVSPIGLVRADAAWPLDAPERSVRFHLSIGPDL